MHVLISTYWVNLGRIITSWFTLAYLPSAALLRVGSGQELGPGLPHPPEPAGQGWSSTVLLVIVIAAASSCKTVRKVTAPQEFLLTLHGLMRILKGTTPTHKKIGVLFIGKDFRTLDPNSQFIW